MGAEITIYDNDDNDLCQINLIAHGTWEIADNVTKKDAKYFKENYSIESYDYISKKYGWY